MSLSRFEEKVSRCIDLARCLGVMSQREFAAINLHHSQDVAAMNNSLQWYVCLPYANSLYFAAYIIQWSIEEISNASDTERNNTKGNAIRILNGVAAMATANETKCFAELTFNVLSRIFCPIRQLGPFDEIAIGASCTYFNDLGSASSVNNMSVQEKIDFIWNNMEATNNVDNVNKLLHIVIDQVALNLAVHCIEHIEETGLIIKTNQNVDDSNTFCFENVPGAISKVLRNNSSRKRSLSSDLMGSENKLLNCFVSVFTIPSTSSNHVGETTIDYLALLKKIIKSRSPPINLMDAILNPVKIYLQMISSIFCNTAPTYLLDDVAFQNNSQSEPRMKICGPDCWKSLNIMRTSIAAAMRNVIKKKCTALGHTDVPGVSTSEETKTARRLVHPSVDVNLSVSDLWTKEYRHHATAGAELDSTISPTCEIDTSELLQNIFNWQKADYKTCSFIQQACIPSIITVVPTNAFQTVDQLSAQPASASTMHTKHDLVNNTQSLQISSNAPFHRNNDVPSIKVTLSSLNITGMAGDNAMTKQSALAEWIDQQLNISKNPSCDLLITCLQETAIKGDRGGKSEQFTPLLTYKAETTSKLMVVNHPTQALHLDKSKRGLCTLVGFNENKVSVKMIKCKQDLLRTVFKTSTSWLKPGNKQSASFDIIEWSKVTLLVSLLETGTSRTITVVNVYSPLRSLQSLDADGIRELATSITSDISTPLHEFVLMGDFNCQPQTKVWRTLSDCINESVQQRLIYHRHGGKPPSSTGEVRKVRFGTQSRTLSSVNTSLGSYFGGNTNSQGTNPTRLAWTRSLGVEPDDLIVDPINIVPQRCGHYMLATNFSIRMNGSKSAAHVEAPIQSSSSLSRITIFPRQKKAEVRKWKIEMEKILKPIANECKDNLSKLTDSFNSYKASANKGQVSSGNHEYSESESSETTLFTCASNMLAFLDELITNSLKKDFEVLRKALAWNYPCTDAGTTGSKPTSEIVDTDKHIESVDKAISDAIEALCSTLRMVPHKCNASTQSIGNNNMRENTLSHTIDHNISPITSGLDLPTEREGNISDPIAVSTKSNSTQTLNKSKSWSKRPRWWNNELTAKYMKIRKTQNRIKRASASKLQQQRLAKHIPLKREGIINQITLQIKVRDSICDELVYLQKDMAETIKLAKKEYFRNENLKNSIAKSARLEELSQRIEKKQRRDTSSHFDASSGNIFFSVDVDNSIRSQPINDSLAKHDSSNPLAQAWNASKNILKGGKFQVKTGFNSGTRGINVEFLHKGYEEIFKESNKKLIDESQECDTALNSDELFVSWLEKVRKKERDEGGGEYPFETHPDNDPFQSHIDFTGDEVYRALAKLTTNKQAGPDAVFNEYLIVCRHSANFIKYLVALFSLVQKYSLFPSNWKQGILFAIPKNGVAFDENDISSSRPITLLSVLGKLYESLQVNRYWTYYGKVGIDHKDALLCVEQAGFRRAGTSALGHAATQINAVSLNQVRRDEYIKNKNGAHTRTKTKGVTVIAGNWDVAKAFDTTSHVGILKSLALLGLPRRALLGHWNGLRHRFTCIFTGEWKENIIEIPSIPVMRGIPQGAVRSPLYYDLFANTFIKRNRKPLSGLDYRLLINPSLHNLLPKEFRFSSVNMFADDIWSSHTNIKGSKVKNGKELVKEASIAAKRNAEFFKANGMLLHTSGKKSQVMALKYKGSDPSEILTRFPLKVDGNIIEEVKHTRLMGATLYQNQVRAPPFRISDGGMIAIQRMQPLITPRNGVSLFMAACIVKSIIIPKCLYSSEFSTMLKSRKNGLARIDQVIRHTIGTYDSTPWSVIQEYTGFLQAADLVGIRKLLLQQQLLCPNTNSTLPHCIAKSCELEAANGNETLIIKLAFDYIIEVCLKLHLKDKDVKLGESDINNKTMQRQFITLASKFRAIGVIFDTNTDEAGIMEMKARAIGLDTNPIVYELVEDETDSDEDFIDVDNEVSTWRKLEDEFTEQLSSDIQRNIDQQGKQTTTCPVFHNVAIRHTPDAWFDTFLENSIQGSITMNNSLQASNMEIESPSELAEHCSSEDHGDSIVPELKPKPKSSRLVVPHAVDLFQRLQAKGASRRQIAIAITIWGLVTKPDLFIVSKQVQEDLNKDRPISQQLSFKPNHVLIRAMELVARLKYYEDWNEARIDKKMCPFLKYSDEYSRYFFMFATDSINPKNNIDRYGHPTCWLCKKDGISESLDTADHLLWWCPFSKLEESVAKYMVSTRIALQGNIFTKKVMRNPKKWKLHSTNFGNSPVDSLDSLHKVGKFMQDIISHRQQYRTKEIHAASFLKRNAEAEQASTQTKINKEIEMDFALKLAKRNAERARHIASHSDVELGAKKVSFQESFKPNQEAIEFAESLVRRNRARQTEKYSELPSDDSDVFEDDLAEYADQPSEDEDFEFDLD